MSQAENSVSIKNAYFGSVRYEVLGLGYEVVEKDGMNLLAIEEGSDEKYIHCQSPYGSQIATYDEIRTLPKVPEKKALDTVMSYISLEAAMAEDYGRGYYADRLYAEMARLRRQKTAA